MYQNGDYSGSYASFQENYGSEEGQQLLYNSMVEEGDYSGTKEEFIEQYFSAKADEIKLPEYNETFKSDEIKVDQETKPFEGDTDDVTQIIKTTKATEDQLEKIGLDYEDTKTTLEKIRTSWGLGDISDEETYNIIKRYKSTIEQVESAEADDFQPDFENELTFYQNRLKELQETDTSGYSQKQLEQHELKIETTERQIQFRKPRAEAKKRQRILEEQGIDLGDKKVSKQSDGLLDKYSKAEQQYLNNEALNKYIKNNYPEEKDAIEFQKSLYGEDGMPTTRYAELLESEEFKNIKNSIELDQDKIKENFTSQLNVEATEANLANYVMDIENDKHTDFGLFSKPERQKELFKEGSDKLANLKEEEKAVLASFDVLSQDTEAIGSRLKELKEYFTTTDLEAKREELSEEEYVKFVEEYLEKASEEKFLINKFNSYVGTQKSLVEQIEKLQLEEKDIETFVDVFKRNHQIGTVLGTQFLNMGIDLGQGIISAADMVMQIPQELVLAARGTPAGSYLTSVAPGTSKPQGGFRSVLGKNSAWDYASKNIDKWQESLQDNIMKPIQFDKISSFRDFGYWASTAVVGQIPQLALMYFTGGASLAILGASSAGSKFTELEEQKDLYDKTGGLYGQDLSFSTMFLNAGFTGIMEAGSERITLGQVRTLKGAIRNNPSAKLGFKQGLQKNIFTFDNSKYAAKDIIEEGSSEVVATMSSNLADILSGDDTKSLYDGVTEAFVTGALVSSSLKVPGTAGKLMRAPFTSKDSNQKIGENGIKVEGLLNRIKEIDPNLPKREQDLLRKDYQDQIDELIEESGRILNNDIKRIDNLKPEDKRVLIEIEVENHKLRKKAEDILANENTTQEQKNNLISLLQRNVNNNLDAKESILAQYKQKDIDNNYARQKEVIESYNKKLKDIGAPTIKVVEAKDQNQMEDIAAQEEYKNSKDEIVDYQAEQMGLIEGLNDLISDPNLSESERDAIVQERNQALKKTGQTIKMLNTIKGNAASFGAMIPRFKDGKISGYEIILNKDRALDKGRFSTAAHEFVHAAFYNTLKADPQMREVLGGAVLEVLKGSDVTFKRGMVNTFNERISLYDRNQAHEELLTQAIEMYIDGDIEISQTGFQKLAGIIRRFAQNYLGYEVSLDTPQDIKNFMIDFAKSVKDNKPNLAIAKMMKRGAKGKMFKNARTYEQRKAEAKFSREADLENKLQDGKISDALDRFVMNENGSPKYRNAQEFKKSNDFYDGYSAITSSKVLDGLIKKDMISLGLQPQDMPEFIRKVKEKLGERYLKNYNYDINKSLFGWLTGISGGGGMSIIYRAKGDVIKEFNQRGEGKTISYEQPTGDKTTIADTIKADQDSYLEKLDNEIIIPGKKQLAKEVVEELLAINILGLSQDAKNSIENAINNFEGDIKSYDYKDIKNLISKVKKIERKGRLVNPTKTSDAVPEGALYSVLETISSHFGVDPLKILANQDLTAAERANAQNLIYSQSVNENGDYDSSLYDALPEGETRSGQATGVANTKLTSFYTTGERLKVSEGAKKELGQKKEQAKRKDVGKEEFLRMFGINSDGTFETSKEFDGAIRAFIVQKAVLAANQGLRLKSITQGTDSDAVRAKLADGKSEQVFSRDTVEDTTTKERWSDVIQLVSENYSDNSYIDAVVDSIYNDLSNAAKTALKKKIKQDRDKAVEVSENLKEIQPEFNIEEELDLLAQEASTELRVKKLLEKQLPKDSNGKTIDIGNLLFDIDRVRKQRGFLSGTISDIVVKDGKVDAKKLESHIKFLMDGYSGLSKIVDGRFEVDSEGNIFEVKDFDQFKTNSRGKRVRKTNRGQVARSKQDFLNLINKGLPKDFKVVSPKQGQYILEGPNTNVNLNVKTIADNAVQFIKDKDFKGRKQQALDSRDIIKTTLDRAWAQVKDPKNKTFDIADFAILVQSLGRGMESPIRKAAIAEYIAEDIESVLADGKKQGKKDKDIVRYEHGTSLADVTAKIINSYVKNNSLDNSVFDNYYVQVISVEHDKAITRAGYQVKSPADGSPRAFNKGILNEMVLDPSLRGKIKPIKSLDPAKKGTDSEFIGKNLIDLYDAYAEGNDVVKQLKFMTKDSKISWSKDTPSRGMSTFDFDETLIIDGENFIEATKGDEVIRVSSAQWPIQGPQLMKDGYDFNFDDFINVRGGVEGPLFQKLKNRIAKFGPENNYILTARPAESAVAIHGWLKSKGINIPLNNITGLGNSTGEAKAQWMLDKFSEGYNDMYFVDDALPNVKAVADVIDQLDIKGKAVQAKIQFSKDADSVVEDVVDGGKSAKDEINLDVIIEQSKGVDRNKKFSTAKAKLRGKRKNRFTFFLPPSAEDLTGLIYPMLGKGKQGEKHYKFFKEKIFDPYAKAVRAVNLLKQQVSTNYKNLRKTAKDVSKRLNKRLPDSDFTLDQAIRVYNYVQAGFDVPGLSQADQNALVKYVESNADVKAFADNVDIIQRNAGGLIEPDDAWLANTISSELNDITDAAREVALAEWQENVNTIFSKENLNKIEAVFGTNHRVALENVLYRMRLGSNRVQTGDNFFGGMMNRFNDWVNGSIGATMFINARSALLQTLSTVNFVNWSDNNPLKFAKAVGNVRQYAKDLAFIFNSPFLKQRRSGLQQDVNARELAEAIAGAKNPIRKAIGYLLQKGFTPTQIADSFAIASGGAAFYRNRINTYLAEGMSKKDAEAKAFNDMQEIAEATQQSARPDKISMQQASPLGKLILAFQNTPMQYNRLMKRAFQDLVNRRGDVRTHISKIVYYGAVQNAIFYSMQQALFALAFGDDDEEEEKVDAYARVGNGMLDSVLRGSGFMGAAVSTMKNVVLEFLEQEEKKHRADHAYTIIEAFNYSPPIGIKARKLYSATQTWEFNRDVIKEMPLTDIDNPVYGAATSAIEAITNAPVYRAYSKIRNIREAMNSDHETYKRVALLLGWSTWNFGIQNEDVIEARQQVKERKKKERKEKRDAEQTEKNRVLEEKFLNEQKQEKKEGKEVTCAAANKAGVRCKNKPVDGIYCTVHQKVEQGDKQVQCKKIKKDGKRCKMQTKNKSGLCYYHD
tara:strand:+ start:1318 stop:10482 length:9165 start_codon:yes stop_codon:yes gene_type:complete